LILDVKKNIKKTLEEVGYPFKSKEHSLKVGEYQKGSRAKSILDYKNRQGKFRCPKKLLYQYDEDFSLKLSDKCCYEFKIKPISHYESESGRTIRLTGMRKEEGGQRANINCIVTDKGGNIKKFHPLAVVTEEWEEWFIDKFNIKLCDLYYEPYNFKRTGCKGCPYSLDLHEQLQKMYLYLPNEAKQCELIWKPVYDEYRRINYRLKGGKDK
jgi:3'-phosphoadenosine 5'-phosphosulfate sulfotransferase (PAPS reductase)/FAD synthetase